MSIQETAGTETIDESKRMPKVTVVYKPLRSSPETARASVAGEAPRASREENASPYLRAENEDDDGYDPYSDRRDDPPLFERNPWD